MPFIANWDEFNEKASEMHQEDPVRFRIMMKYRHNDGKLVLKVTNDKKVCQYLVEQPKEVKNVDKFLSTYMKTFCH
jgi:hypothetical protein